MVAVKLWGGLGNQMFQYAFGKHLSILFGEKLYFYISDENYSEQKIDLLKYNVQVQLLTEKEISKFTILKGKGIQYRIERKILKSIPFLNTKIFIEPSLLFCSSVKNSASLFDGYWQSYKYIEQIENIVRHELTLKDDFTPFLLLKEDIENKNSVSLHIRRGDYLAKGFNKVYAFCDEKYYHDAIEFFSNRIKNPTFYIFSNELDWVRSNLKIFDEVDVVFVDNSTQVNANLLDMYLMSLCKHNIIANSTFSWWGAWLNRNTEKIVIAPEHWYNGDLNKTTIDLIPPTWFRI